MLGLLTKDLFLLKRNSRIFAFIFVFYLILAINSTDYTLLCMVLLFMTAIMPISTFSYDDLAKWDPYALTMPISKRNLVFSKYLSSIVLSAIGFLFSSLFYLIVITAKHETFDLGTIKIFAVGLMAVILFTSIMFPCIYYFGVEKSRYIMYVVFAIPTVIFIMIRKSAGKLPAFLNSKFIHFIRENYLGLGAILVVLLFFLSINLSLAIMNKKEY